MNENTQQRTVTINAYTAKELRNAHKRAFDQAHIDHVEFVWASYGNDQVAEYMVQHLEEEWPGLKDLELGWSLSHSQGDGVCFKATTLTDAQRNSLVKADERVTFSIINNDLPYTHEYTFMVSWSSDGEELPDEVAIELDRQAETVTNDLRQICRDLKKVGYAMVEWLESEENFLDAADSNEWLFDSNGQIIN